MPDNITLQLDGLESFKSDVRASVGEIKGFVKDAMVKSVNIVKNTAQDTVAYKTGTLRRSIFTDIQDNGFTGIVAQDSNIASYGADIEYGTAAHTITPVNKKALFWKGAMHPVKSVNHPGTSPRPFMFPALEANIDNVQRFFDEMILKLVQFMAGKK